MKVKKTLHEIYMELKELRELRSVESRVLASIVTDGGDSNSIKQQAESYKRYDEIIKYLSEIEVEYEDKYEGENGGVDTLDWEVAKEHLYEMEKAYESIGKAGFIGLGFTINPLINKFESGDRTKELFEDIMNIK